jgi:hypothetical protein
LFIVTIVTYIYNKIKFYYYIINGSMGVWWGAWQLERKKIKRKQTREKQKRKIAGSGFEPLISGL